MSKASSKPEEKETLSSVHDDLLNSLEEALQWTKGEKNLIVTTRTEDDSRIALPKFQIYRDLAGEFRWRLKADTGEILADSKEAYKSRESCEQSLERLKRNVSIAGVEFQMTA